MLDPRPVRPGGSEAHIRRLRALASGDPLELLRLEIEAAPAGVDGEGRTAELQRLADAGQAVAVGTRRQRWFSPRLLETARAGLVEAVDAGDDPRPRSAAALAHAAGLDPGGAAVVLDALAAEGTVASRDGGYLPAGTGPPDPLGRRLLAMLEEDALQPRSLDALANAAAVSRREARDGLERLAARGEVTRLKPGLYYHPRALESAREEVVALCRRDGAATIASLRDRLATSRKYAQALLEHFDAAHLTRRVGDEHVLRRK